MSSVTDHLDRWLRAGLIDAATAARIRDYEQSPAQEQGTPGFERPGILEAVVYLGLVVVAVGAIVLVGTNWDQLSEWARVASIGVPAAITLLVGAALRAIDRGPMRRGGQAAWLVSVALFAGTLAVAFDQFQDPGDWRTAVMIISSITFAYAVTLWTIEPSYPQVVAVGGTVLFVAQAAGGYPDEFSVEVVAVTGVLLATVGLVLGEIGMMQPLPGTRVVFSLIALATSFMASFETALGWEFLLFVVAAALIAAGVWRSTFIYLALGVLGSFLALVTFMFAHFSSELGAPLALIITGAMLLAAAFITMEARKFIHRSPA